ncbi:MULTISPECIES: hypothetical protein [Cryobacterium]|uniref:Uncharacterized protein n=3 Tax=Cryobacterium TaxID=69578 RepID=A0ABY2IUB2_9MICO|nr:MULTISPECIES: hypothetical protein [Cryobacterium]TFB96035.1 hypothetical protein E3O39_11740 [Cryobacterium sp. MDB2-A-1]TFC07927.1 hypothetical protein E3O59_09160 [Cryobacterium sp. MDB2-33-2]TFC13195.1 hypothetical protein E3O35_05995 [Cryobacterium sp. MDB2-A-2]TFC23013.1 hypothetical protein E3O46_02560 [Cryobacterium glucosi]TFC40439.1 hypothetical protein E3O50_13845 [Cryobacterium sp. MDB1-18-1]
MSATGDFRDVEREALLRRSQRSAARTAGKNPPAARASQPATGTSPVVRLGRSAAITFNPALLSAAERSRFSRHMNARVSPGKGVLSNAEYYAQQAFVDVAQISVPTVSGRDNVNWVLKRGDGSTEVVPDFVARAVQPREAGYPGVGTAVTAPVAVPVVLLPAALQAAPPVTGLPVVAPFTTAPPIAASFAAAPPAAAQPVAAPPPRPSASAAAAALAAAAETAVAQAAAAQAAAAEAETAQAEAAHAAAVQTAAAQAAAHRAVEQAEAAQAAIEQAARAQAAAAHAEAQAAAEEAAAAQAAAAQASAAQASAAQAAAARAAAAQAINVPLHVPLAGPSRLPAPPEPEPVSTVRSAAESAAHLAAQRAPQAPLTRSARAPMAPAPGAPIVANYAGTVTGSQILRAERDRAREILARATELRVKTGQKSTGPNYRAALISENRARTKFFELNTQTEQATAREARIEYAALLSSLTEGTENYRIEYEAQLSALLAGVTLPALTERIAAAETIVHRQDEIAGLATDSAERWAAGSPQRKVNHTE